VSVNEPKGTEMNFSRAELVARLVKAGELEVLGGDQVETDSYFDAEHFRFHGPGGLETDYSGLTNYFKPYAQRSMIAQSVGVLSSLKAST
jgi:hypothetical protein